MGSTRTDAAPSRARAAIVALALLAAVVGGVLSQPITARAAWDENDCREISPPQLRDAAAAQGRLKMTVKILVIQGQTLVVKSNDEVNLRLTEDLQRAAILDIKQINEGDNARVYGYMNPRDARQFIVMNIDKLADDATLYREKIAALDKAGDPSALFALAEQIRTERAAAKKKEAYDQIAREADRAAIAIKERAAKPDDPQAWISLCDDYLRLLGDRQGALERLVKAMKPGEQVPPPEVRRRLDQLNANLYGGEYVLFEEMKRREGFIERGGKWVLKERAAFEDAVQNRMRNRTNVRRLLPDYYRTVASAGNTESGMTKEEVSQAIGFPDEIDRVRAGGGNDIMDAWYYEGRGWYYFDGSVLYLQAPDR